MSLKTLLVTGGCGFIGSNFIQLLNRTKPDIKIINIDKLTYASDPKNLEGLENPDSYHFYKLDICQQKELRELFQKYNSAAK